MNFVNRASSKVFGDKLKIPVIQGGMGVGISMGRLAGSVAACGGMGVISTALIGFREEDFYQNHVEADVRALRKEIQIAKEIANGRGMIAINAMTVTTDYGECIEAAVREGIDAVISGAGLPLALPELVDGKDVLIAPIASSAKAAALIMKNWNKKCERRPDFIVVEGSGAGGHLGFKKEELLDQSYKPLTEIVSDVVKVCGDIPVFAAGGIFDADDIKKLLKCGAYGVQIGTRFIACDECDASQGFKNKIIKAGSEDLMIIQSPVGLPGRALKSPLHEQVEREGRKAPSRCINCISTCDPKTTPYCISEALIAGFNGDEENGLFFSGENCGRIDKIVSVKDLMDELSKGFE